MVNMVPQRHELNTGPWEKLEQYERSVAERPGANALHRGRRDLRRKPDDDRPRRRGADRELQDHRRARDGRRRRETSRPRRHAIAVDHAERARTSAARDWRDFVTCVDRRRGRHRVRFPVRGAGRPNQPASSRRGCSTARGVPSAPLRRARLAGSARAAGVSADPWDASGDGRQDSHRARSRWAPSRCPRSDSGARRRSAAASIFGSRASACRSRSSTRSRT